MRLLRLRKPRLVLAALSFIAAAGFAVQGLPALRLLADSSPAAEAVPAPPMPPAPARQAEEVEVVTLLPEGFDPASISRPAGRVLLVVDNRSGLDEVLIRLAAAGGEQIYEARARRGTRALRKAFDLPPGDYTLSEAGHPDWVCRLNVTH